MKRNSKKFKIRRKLPNIITVFIMIFGLIIIYFIFQGKEVRAEWFNDNWMYRQKITANNNSNFDATDVPYKVLVDTSTLITDGKMQSDGDDIRIINESGQIVRFQTEESTLNTSETGIWFEATVEDNGSASYYLYYGNPSAPSLSFSNDVESESGDGAIVKMKDGFGYSTHTTHGKLSDVRKNGTNLGINGASRNTDSYPGSWWDDRAFARTLLATGPLFVEVQFEDTNYGHYSSFGTIVKMFNNGFVANRVYMNYNNSGTEDLYYYLHFDSGTRNSVWVNGSGTLVDQAEDSGTLYQADLGDSWFGQRWTATGHYGGTIVTENNSDWNRGFTSAQSSYYQTNYSYSEAYSNGESREIRFATFAGDGGLNEMNEKGSLYGANSTSLASEEQSPGPVAYWKFDEGADDTCSGGTNDTCDSTQNGLDGAKTNAVWQSEDMCVSGKCLYFDGSGDYVTVTDGGSNDPQDLGISDFTTCVWTKFLGGTAYGRIIQDGQYNSVNGWEITKNNQDDDFNFYVGFYTDSSKTRQFWTGQTYKKNTWYYLCATFDRDGYSKIYIDGVQDGSLDISSFPSESISNSNNLTMGYGSGNAYNGFIDEVKIYPYVRSAAQIKADYLSGSAGTGGSAASAVLGGKPQKWLSDGLVGYWKMDENTGQTVGDSSGTGNDGTLASSTDPSSADPTWTATSTFGTALEFDGSDDYVDLGSGWNPSNDFTASAWIKTSQNTSGDTRYRDPAIIATNGIGGLTEDWTLTNYNGKLSWYDQFGAEHSHQSTKSINDGLWHHVSVVRDNATVYLYADGVLVDTINSGATSIRDHTIYVGRFEWSEALYFDGTIDEVRIYNRALSSKEIRDLYNWAPGPVVYYNFNEKSGASVYDKSGNNLTGTFTSTPSWVQGKYGGGLQFDQASDDGVYTVSTSLFNYEDYTVGFWMKHTDDHDSSYRQVFTKKCSTDRCPGVWVNPSYVGYHWKHNPNNYGPVAIGPTGENSDFTLNQWYYITGAKNGATFEFYVNGIQVGSDYALDVPMTQGDGILYIGDSTGYQSAGFIIDEFKFYNYARTQKQIIEDMNAGHPAVGSPVGSALLYLKLDEGYGTTAYDSGYNGDNGDLIDGPNWINNAKFGKGIDLDGLNDRIQGFTSNPFEYTGNGLTLSIWVNQDSGETTSGYIISKPWNSSGQYNYGLVLNSNDTLTFSLLGSSSWSTATTDTLSTGTWTHLVVTVEGTTSAVKIYKDGKVIKSDTHTITGWTPSLGDANVSLCVGSFFPYSGGWGGNTGFSFDGKIDEVKIYNFALTEDEIKLDYNRSAAVLLGAVSTDSSGNPDWSSSREYCVPGDTSTCNAPIAEWKLDKKTGIYAYDTSGNGNTGTLTQGPTWAVGKHGSAVKFDGINDHINFSDVDFISNQEFTLSLWAYNNEHKQAFITGDEASGNHGVMMQTNSSGYIQTYYDGYQTSSYQLPLSTWTFITYKQNSSGLYLIINGGEYEEELMTDKHVNTDSNFYIAAFNSNSRLFNGIVDHVKIYNYARTQAQIAWDYNRGKPVGYWKFDAGEGMTAYDASGNSNNGTLEASMTSGDWVEGKYNTALDFDGGNDYVSIGNPSELNITGEVTLSAWLKTNEASGSKTVVSRGYAYMINAYYGSGIEFYAHDGTDSTGCSVSWDSGWTDNWIFLTTTIRPYTDGWTIKGYVNGVEKCSGTHSNFDGPRDTSESVYIGSLNGTGRYQNGQIDDVRIYNYALTQEQIKNVMNQGAAIRFGPSEGSP